MGPDRPLPYGAAFDSADQYVDSLLEFVSKDDLLRQLCGGVHILDFFTSETDLYSRLLPLEWRTFFSNHDIMDLLDLFMREDLTQKHLVSEHNWRDGPAPPQSLIEYLENVRRHLLDREPPTSRCSRNRTIKSTQKLARHVAVGMNVKKVHEVGLFARYLDDLTKDITASTGTQVSHLVDFGSGQNYLGRALASEPYNQRIVAIESKSHNAERAREFDVMAKLATKEKIMRNKKNFRAGLDEPLPSTDLPTPPPEAASSAEEQVLPTSALAKLSLDPSIEASTEARGKIQYVEHRIQDGNLQDVISTIHEPSPNLMIMSLHSCGNLVHHGLRSLLLNPSVRAVAMVGCCYNLVTERLGPATYKLPSLQPHPPPIRSNHPRLEETSNARDPHGFPMSDRLCTHGSESQGVRLNITARMMAVQAPQNWGAQDSERFFTRHFYRALLQRIFFDRGIVGPPSQDHVGAESPSGHSSGTPVIIGTLPKSCYTDFVAYVRGALGKLYGDKERGQDIKAKTADLSDEEIKGYEARFAERRKDLSVIWSLMAYSAGVVEATIVVDRWLWLREKEEVKEAWVEPVFEYGLSPRNLVVVGIKR